MKLKHLLLVFWVIATLLFAKQIKIFDSALQGRYTIKNLGVVETDNGGRTLIGRIRSHYYGLGNILVRLADNSTVNDKITFRLRESGSESWWYEGTHNPDNFVRGELYAFGFPIIFDSREKDYEFQIIIGDGSKNETVLVGQEAPVLITRHFISLYQMREKPGLFLYFLSHKMGTILFNSELFWMSFYLLLPFLMYTLYQEAHRTPFVFFVLVLSIPIIVLSTGSSHPDILYLWVISFLIYASLDNKIDPKIFIYIAMIFLTTAATSKLFGSHILSEKFAIWSLCFVTTGSILNLINLKYNNLAYISSRTFLIRLWIEIKKIARFTYFVAIGEIEIAAKNMAGKRGEAEMGLHKIALIVYQFGKPVLTTYIITTRLVYLLIISIIVVFRITIKYGPYALLAWALWSVYDESLGFSRFYSDFFIVNQVKLFWDEVGRYLIVLYLGTLVIFLLLQKKQTNIKSKVLIAIILLVVSRSFAKTIFYGATPQRDSVITWVIQPNEISEPWVDVIIVGRNFKEMPFEGKVLIGGVGQRIIHWSDRKIIFRTNPLTTKSGSLVVQTVDGYNSNPTQFNYTGNR